MGTFETLMEFILLHLLMLHKWKMKLVYALNFDINFGSERDCSSSICSRQSAWI